METQHLIVLPNISPIIDDNKQPTHLSSRRDIFLRSLQFDTDTALDASARPESDRGNFCGNACFLYSFGFGAGGFAFAFFFTTFFTGIFFVFFLGLGLGITALRLDVGPVFFVLRRVLRNNSWEDADIVVFVLRVSVV